MMKQEFENLIGKQVSDKNYEVIDRLSTLFPDTSVAEVNKQIADVYNAGGMELISHVLETVDIMNSLKKELEEAVVDLEKVLKIMGFKRRK
jgi:hypothetical protein